ncbi:MAG: NAD(P)-dependent glycerol-3-phosphate dehydrogenase [Calditrichaeota bacterium]|nr:NAD(P)-dependent glycerol-3-phosphate dehydrogenase [Calditrichota bacterium]MCB9366535.1 NAD(P)-dependent glycerol-3-phosphate dehydrogenase [Calditrichota bacterium]MCB9391207.1 NAD(P)-dependent glycerol-3-phosphate dehydrogenase [Calditrichota bacterium]
MKVAILGAGSWGTALAIHAARVGNDVVLWARDRNQAKSIRQAQENARYLPGQMFPAGVAVTSEFESAISRCELLILAIPLQSVREFVKSYGDNLPRVICIGTAKGIEAGSGLLEQEILSECLRGFDAELYASLSGPTLAAELAMGMPTSAVIASQSEGTAQIIQREFSSEVLRLYRSTDVRGVEFAGAMKNVIALAAGMIDGISYGSNTKGALITRGLAELSRLGEAIGGDRKTFMGLSGLGDLATTCMSPRSRNRTVGEHIGRGESLENALRKTEQVAEGVWTARAAFELGIKHKVATPITAGVCAVLEGKLSARDAVRGLMERELKEED